jgi:hypothetical protein
MKIGGEGVLHVYERMPAEPALPQAGEVEADLNKNYN